MSLTTLLFSPTPKLTRYKYKYGYRYRYMYGYDTMIVTEWYNGQLNESLNDDGIIME
jgi:hypothetical protein